MQREFKCAAGELMTSGCTGGNLFVESNFKWLDSNNHDTFVVLWEQITLPRMLPLADWIADGISAEVANENKWWMYSSDTSHLDVTRPDWWDVTEGDMRVSHCSVLFFSSIHSAQRYFPEQMVPKAYLAECDSLTEMAAGMLQSMQQLLQHKFHF